MSLFDAEAAKNAILNNASAIPAIPAIPGPKYARNSRNSENSRGILSKRVFHTDDKKLPVGVEKPKSESTRAISAPCTKCGGRYFWLNPGGDAWHCGTCAPPPLEASTLTLPGGSVPEDTPELSWEAQQVTCGTCTHYIQDTHGHGGIGACVLGDSHLWNDGKPVGRALYPHAKRRCTRHESPS